MVFRHRSHVVVKGVGRVGSGGRDMAPVKTRISAVLAEVGANRGFEILSVIVYGASHPVYNVELESEDSVRSILSAFSRFTRRHEPVTRPASLDGVGLYHAVTPGTRVRLSLLRVRFLFVLPLCSTIMLSDLYSSVYRLFSGRLNFSVLCLSLCFHAFGFSAKAEQFCN